MSKKVYIKPTTKEVLLMNSAGILAGSGVNGNGMGYGGEGAEGEEIGSRRRGRFFDDEEDY